MINQPKETPMTTISTISGLVVTPDGTMATVALDADTLDDMRTIIDCSYVDVIGLPGQLDMWVDDEGGLIHGAERNTFAQLASGREFIFGTVLFLAHDGHGETVSMNREQACSLPFDGAQILVGPFTADDVATARAAGSWWLDGVTADTFESVASRWQS